MHTIEDPEPLPSFVLQNGKTAFYETLLDNELERRQSVSQAMTWLRPIDRLFKVRELARIDERLLRFSETIAASRLIDEAIEQQAAKASAVVSEVQPILLDNDPAAQHALTVIQDS